MKRIELIIQMRYAAVMTRWRAMSMNKSRDSLKGSGKMPATERLVIMSPRKRIKRRSGVSDVSGAGLAGGAMVALRLG